MTFDPSRIYTTLQNTQLQQKDNPLYQVIRDLITALVTLNSLIGESGSGSSTAGLTNAQIAARVLLDSEGGSGIQGSIGSVGPIGITGPPGADGEEIDSGFLGIDQSNFALLNAATNAFLGNATFAGSTGVQLASNGSFFYAQIGGIKYKIAGFNASGTPTFGSTKLVTVNDNGTVAINTSQSGGGLLVIIGAESGGLGNKDECALYWCRAGAAFDTVLISDPSGVYNITPGTAGRINVYAAGSPSFTLENKRGATRSFYFAWIGFAG